MTDERKPERMTEEEIAAASGEPVPERVLMSVVRGADPLMLEASEPMKGDANGYGAPVSQRDA